MATDHNFKVKNGLTVQGETLVVNHTGDLSGTQVYIKRKDSSTNLQRWGEGTTDNANSYRFRIDQNFAFIGNSGSGDNIKLSSGDGSIQGASYKVGGTTIVDSARSLANIHDITFNGVARSTNNANVDGPNFNVSTTNKDTAEYAYRVDRSGTIKGGVTINGVFKSFTGVDLTPDSAAYLNFHRGAFATFYGNSNSHHAIGSRDISGAQSDDLRINSYADVIINLDSNSNNTSNADLIIGRHGGGTSTVSQLHRISGEQGTSSSYIGSNATYSKPLLEITTSATPTQIKITTNILYSGSGASTHAHSVTIRGFQYGGAQMADLQIGWHVYNNEFYNRSVVSSGSWAPTVTLAVENNKVVIHLASPGYWPKLYVESMYNAYGGSGQAIGWSWSDAAISADSNTPNQTVPYKSDFGNNVKIDSSGNFKVGNSTVINSSRELHNLNGNIRSDNTFQFLTMGGSAQNVRTKSVFAGTSYGDTPPAGSFNATNTYELNGTTVIDNSRNLVNIDTVTATGYLRTSSNGIYGKMSDEWHTANALRGGNFSADIGNDTTVLTLFPASHLDESGNARAANDYSTGIKFMHLDPDYSTWGSSYGGGQAWIGLKVESTPGQEFSSFVIATNASSTAGTFPTERLTVSKEGRVTINNVNDAYNFKAMAGDADSWFGVYDDANNSANIIVTRSDTTTSFLHKGHNGETTIAGITKVQRDVRSAGQVRATGWWNEGATTDYDGFAYEIGVSGGTAFALAYNRNNDSYGNMQFNANNFEFNNPVKINDGSNISMDANGNGQFEIAGNGYVGAISLDGSNMNIYHNSANRGLVLGVNEAARLHINTDGDVNIFHSESIYGATRWYVSQSDSAHQRVDVRDESTAGRAHWYGVLSDGSTSNFRHAWYTGSGYINVDANTSGIVFGGTVNANSLSVPGIVTFGNTSTTPAADLRLYGTGNNYLRIRGTANNDFEIDLQGTSSTGELSFNQFNVTINNSGTLDCGPVTVTGTSAGMNGLVMGSSTQSDYTNILLYSNSGNGQIWKTGSGDTSWGGTSAVNIYNSNGSINFHPAATANVVKIDNDGLHVNQSGDYISAPATSTRTKFSLYGKSDTTYAIGMQAGITYGGLSDWGMTFQFNNENDRGFWWGDSVHDTSQGAMALTTDGRLTVANAIRVGYGESDTTTPGAAYDLDVSGHGQVTGRFYAIDGLLKTNRRITTAQVNPIGHFSEGDQVFALDTSWTDAELQAYFNSSNVSWNADSTAPGGYAVYINGNVNVGGVYNSGFPYIPVDEDDLFYMECWIRNAGTDQRHYMGSNEFNQSFSSLGGNPGSYGYWVMSNTNPGTSWTKVSGYIGGFHASTTGKFEIGTKYWTPQALFNYSAGSGTRACYISGWKVIRVRHKGERTFDDDMTINSRLILNNTVTNTLTLTGNGAGISFSGGNNRIFFGGYRAMEGATNGTNLQIGETYTNILLQATNTQLSSSSKLLFNGTSNYGIGAGGHNFNSGYFDTLESGSSTDPLELVYYQGPGINVGPSGTKYLNASTFGASTSTTPSSPGNVGYYTAKGLQFGSSNSGKETNSAQISAGEHQSNSLNFVGMSSNTSPSTRRMDFWVENGAYFRGSIIATGNVTAYGSASDERLKTNIVKIENPIAKLQSVSGYTFDWNENAPEDKQGLTEYGVIAQEVEKAGLNELVFEYERPVNKTGGDDTPPEQWKAVHYEKFVPILIEAIKEQQDKIEKLEELVEKLISEK